METRNKSKYSPKEKSTEETYRMNPRRVIHGPCKFCQKFKGGSAIVSVSEDQYKLAILHKVAGWAVISPRGKVIRQEHSMSIEAGYDEIKDIIYIQQQRAFFIYKNQTKEIWKMSLDDLQPRLWIQDRGIETYYFGKMFKEALKGKAIVIMKSEFRVIIIEIKDDGSSGRAATSNLLTKELFEIEVGGKHGDIFIGLDKGEKELLSCKINDDLKVEVVGRFNLSSVIDEGGESFSIAITPCSEYVFVHTCNKGITTKQLIISVKRADINVCAVLDLSSEKLRYFHSSLAYLRTVGDLLIFKAIPFGELPSTVLTFMYNKKTKQLNELKTQRKTIKDRMFVKLTRQGNTIYTIGFRTSKLVKIT